MPLYVSLFLLHLDENATFKSRMSWLNNAYGSILTTKVGIQKVTNYYKYGVFIRLRKKQSYIQN